MRRAVAAAALVFVGALAWSVVVRAQIILPTRGPAPSATPSQPRVFLPYLRRDATPTPAPIQCRDMIRNGGFEAGTEWWDVSGRGAVVSAGRPSSAPIEGAKLLEVWPGNDNQWLNVKSAGFAPPDPAKVESATLRFSIRGFSLDRIERSDALLVIIRDPDFGRCSACNELVDGYFNGDMEGDWFAQAFDVTKYVKEGWSEVSINFAAQDDFLDSTWWHIDAVSLTICSAP